jgi:hypothetical protein
MFMTRVSKPLAAKMLTVVAVAGIAAVAWTLPAGADVQGQSPPVAGVRVQPLAAVGTRGAVVTVTVIVVCARGATAAQVEVDVNERVAGGVIARGLAASPVTCTATLDTMTVAVPAHNRAFTPGAAFATAQFSVCNSAGCRPATDQREVRITH